MPLMGEALTFKAVFYDLDGAIRTDVTVAAAVRKPDGTAISPTPGVTQVGNWYQAGVSSGQNDAAGEWVATFAATDDGDVAPLNAVVGIVVETASEVVDPGEIAAAVVNALGAAPVAFIRTNILLNGNIDKLVAGDAYTVENGTAIMFLIPASLPYDLETATITLRIRRPKGKVIIDDVAVEVVTVGSKKYLRFELTTEQSGRLEPDDNNPYKFAFRATWETSDMSPKTILFGDIERVLAY